MTNAPSVPSKPQAVMCPQLTLRQFPQRTTLLTAPSSSVPAAAKHPLYRSTVCYILSSTAHPSLALTPSGHASSRRCIRRHIRAAAAASTCRHPLVLQQCMQCNFADVPARCFRPVASCLKHCCTSCSAITALAALHCRPMFRMCCRGTHRGTRTLGLLQKVSAVTRV